MSHLNVATVVLEAQASSTTRATSPKATRSATLEQLQGVLSGLAFLSVRLCTLVGAMLTALAACLIGLLLFTVRAVVRRLFRWHGALAAVTVGAALCAAPIRAHADEIPVTALDKTGVIFTPKLQDGSRRSQADTYSFNLSGPGELSVHLYDMNWPAALQDLSCAVLSPTKVLGAISSVGSFDIRVGQAGMFYAYVVGLAGNALSAGEYSLHIVFTPNATPVPLPDAIRMLLVGLGLIGTVRLMWSRVGAQRAFNTPSRNESVISPA